MSALLARSLRIGALLAAFGVLGTPPAAAMDVAARTVTAAAVDDDLLGWQWPISPPRITAAFVAPAHDYGPGHRGIDLAAPRGTPVQSPAAGVIAFSGSVAGRGVVTIDHGSGLVTTLEPVTAAPPIGTAVTAGDIVATADVGGHSAVGDVHFGVRRDGVYINPMLLLGGIPRAVLLPCCAE